MAFNNADEDILRQSLVLLVQYHDAFRIKYQKDENSRVFQYYDDKISEVNILRLDISHINNADEKKMAVINTLNILNYFQNYPKTKQSNLFRILQQRWKNGCNFLQP